MKNFSPVVTISKASKRGRINGREWPAGPDPVSWLRSLQRLTPSVSLKPGQASQPRCRLPPWAAPKARPKPSPGQRPGNPSRQPAQALQGRANPRTPRPHPADVAPPRYPASRNLHPNPRRQSLRHRIFRRHCVMNLAAFTEPDAPLRLAAPLAESPRRRQACLRRSSHHPIKPLEA